MSAERDIYPLGHGEEMSEAEYQSYYADPDLIGEMAYQAACDARVDVRPPKTLFAPAGEWHTRDGAVLRIVEMTTDHLGNAIRLFERGGFGDYAKIRELREEIAIR